MKATKSISAIYAGLAMILGVLIAGELFGADTVRRSNPFASPSIDAVIRSKNSNRIVLTPSDDFKGARRSHSNWPVIAAQVTSDVPEAVEVTRSIGRSFLPHTACNQLQMWPFGEFYRV